MTALSRRTLLLGAGTAAAAPAVAYGREAAAGAASAGPAVLGLIGTVLQEGSEVTAYGWVTQVGDLPAAALFTDPGHRGAATARLRWSGDLRLDALDVLPRVAAARGSGRLRICFAPRGGAHEDDPESFSTGLVVAEHAARARTVETVVSAKRSVVDVSAVLIPRTLAGFRLGGRPCRLGALGREQHLKAGGSALRLGERSTRVVAGDLLLGSAA